MTVALVTDSTCDLAPDVTRKLGIHVIPLRVKVDQETYLDWVNLDPDTLYERQRSGANVRTAPPTQQQFEDLYLKLLETHDSVVSVHLSAPLSETLQRARQAVAAHRIGARVLVIDSGLASVGLAGSVLAIHEALQAGADADLAQVIAQRFRSESGCQFTVPTLEYLRRGGRVSRSQEVVGNLLNMRPVMTFEDGHIRVDRRVQQGKALGDIIRKFEEDFGDQPVTVTVAHAGRDPERLAKLRAAVEESRLNVTQGRKQLIGSVIGAHVGPGFYGISVVPADLVQRTLSAPTVTKVRRLGRH